MVCPGFGFGVRIPGRRDVGWKEKSEAAVWARLVVLLLGVVMALLIVSGSCGDGANRLRSAVEGCINAQMTSQGKVAERPPNSFFW